MKPAAGAKKQFCESRKGRGREGKREGERERERERIGAIVLSLHLVAVTKVVGYKRMNDLDN